MKYLAYISYDMAKKRTLSDLIRDEVEQQSLLNIDSTSDEPFVAIKQKKGSCVPEIKPTHEPKSAQWVQTYWVSRRGIKHQYYRFCYLLTPGDIGSCVRVHIPGGNTKSDRALLLKEKVESAIALFKSPTEIITLIQSEKRSRQAVAPRQTSP